MAVAVVLAAAVAFGAALVLAQATGTLLFRDVPPAPAMLVGALAALTSGVASWLALRSALRLVTRPGREGGERIEVDDATRERQASRLRPPSSGGVTGARGD